MISEEIASRFYGKSKLINSSLSSYRNISYLDIEKALKLFLKYSSHEDSSVQKQAIESINSVAAYNLEVYKKCGLSIQKEAVRIIESLPSEDRKKHFSGLVAVSRNLLSPELKFTSSNYQGITLTSANHSGDDTIQDIRQRIIIFLENLYHLAINTEDKKAVLSTLNNACRTPYRGGYNDEFHQIILRNIQDVLGISEKILGTENDLQLIQEIEEDTYWLYYHHTDKAVRRAACEVKAIIDTRDEYQIFKVLIGFRGVFYSWCGDGDKAAIGDVLEDIGNKVQRTDNYRERRFQELVAGVCPENYGQWEKRILDWSGIQSNDIATFLYFGRFLELVGKNSPNFALRLINEHDEQLNTFMVPLIIGILLSNQKDEFQTLTRSWLSQQKHLWVMTRVCENAQQFDPKLFREVTQIALKQRDLITLHECLSALFLRFEQGGNALINSLFPEILEVLTECRDSRWIQNVWHQENIQAIAQILEEETIVTLLDNLLCLERVDYMAEYILAGIAERNPEKVLDFFGKRIESRIEDELGLEYQAVPFSFDRLSIPLAKNPEQTVRTIRKWYNNDRSILFGIHGAKLLNNIFPEFEEAFKNEILKLLKGGDEEDQQFILAILRNYRGIVIYDVIKELIKKLPRGSRELNDIMIILQGTGVVTGEYGFVEAYKRRKTQIESWLENDDPKIRDFAEDYISMLDQFIDGEEKRAKERITLMKHRYRED